MKASTTIDTDVATRSEQGGARLWQLAETPDLRAFVDAPWPPLISTLLARRGIDSTTAAKQYLGPPGDLIDAHLMPNLDLAVARLMRACTAGETVAIFGDYDVDGVTATVILVEGLRALGARPVPYLPDRFTEGYGPNVAAVRALAATGATVLVTADTGTSAVVEVGVANELGMDVLILDHHTVPAQLPDAFAIVNPRLLGSQYGSEPAAVGVAYKVVHDLYAQIGRSYDPAEHRALVALGTVCDVAPMLAENRNLVRLGMDALQRTQRPGLRALAEVARVSLRDADPEMCGWVLGPRLNAAGRMAHARFSLDLLLAPDEATARARAAELEAFNEQRRDSTAAALALAEESLTPAARAGALLIVASEAISSGVVGLVAARLAETYHRPAIAIELRNGEGRASCRSIPGFDITALLQRHAHLFRRFGGHRAAAGFTIDAARLDEVRATLGADAAERLAGVDLQRSVAVEAELPLEAINGDLLGWLQRLGPHGQGNPAPILLARGVPIAESRVVGADASHLQLTIRAGRVTWRAIAFGGAAQAVGAGERADLVYRFRRDGFRGTLQLEVVDLRPSR